MSGIGAPELMYKFSVMHAKIGPANDRLTYTSIPTLNTTQNFLYNYLIWRVKDKREKQRQTKTNKDKQRQRINLKVKR